MRRILSGFIQNGLSLLDVKMSRSLKKTPKSILFPIIWITRRCNLKCAICNQWKSGPDLIENELSTKYWLSFIDSAKRLGALFLSVTGGEPFLRDDIFDILKYINEKGLKSHVVTNGTLIDEKSVYRLKSAGVKSITVSLDSYIPEIHNEIRGADCFHKTVSAVKLIKEIIPDLRVGINCVITKKNFVDIYKMVAFAEKLGVGQVRFDSVHTNLMHRGNNSDGIEGLIFNENDLLFFKKEIERLIKSVCKTKLLTNSCYFLKNLPNIYSRCSNKNMPCYAGYISCIADPSGYVSVCDNIEGLDSLRDKPLEDIWQSDSFQSLRHKVIDCNLGCWDTTHGELNIRCSLAGIVRNPGLILKEADFYF